MTEALSICEDKYGPGRSKVDDVVREDRSAVKLAPNGFGPIRAAYLGDDGGYLGGPDDEAPLAASIWCDCSSCDDDNPHWFVMNASGHECDFVTTKPAASVKLIGLVPTSILGQEYVVKSEDLNEHS